MEPTLGDGDLLVGSWGARVAAGQVAVVRLPPDASGHPRPVSVKRVTGVDPDDARRWWLDSDNPREGVTSFDVGSVGDDDVLGVVLCRLFPRPRWLRGRHAPDRS